MGPRRGDGGRAHMSGELVTWAVRGCAQGRGRELREGEGHKE